MMSDTDMFCWMQYVYKMYQDRQASGDIEISVLCKVMRVVTVWHTNKAHVFNVGVIVQQVFNVGIIVQQAVIVQ